MKKNRKIMEQRTELYLNDEGNIHLNIKGERIELIKMLMSAFKNDKNFRGLITTAASLIIGEQLKENN